MAVLPLNAAASDAFKVFGGATGSWAGELYYLDYGSGQRFAIPMQVTSRTTPDGVTLIRETTWTDPGNLVYAVGLLTIDRATGELVETFFREQRAEMFRYQITELLYDSPTSWKLVYEQEGKDDDRPATIQHVLQRTGDTLDSTKSVRFAGESAFFLRNGTTLQKQP